MLSSMTLDGMWKLRGFDGQHGSPESYLSEGVDERTFIDAQVPGEVHLDLERAGIIPDCNLGLNAQSARWVEEQVWVYRTAFTAPEEALSQHAWLVFEGLDISTIIYLNGEEIGRHENAFVPCRLDVTGKLRPGKNLLAVRIESGLYSVADKQGQGYVTWLADYLTKRSWLRKPQYSFSWDWSPRLINVGIWRPVRLEWSDSARIDAVTVYSELSADHTSARVNARLFVENVRPEPVRALLRMKVLHPLALHGEHPNNPLSLEGEGKGEGGNAGFGPHQDLTPHPGPLPLVEREIELPSGISRQDISVEIANPELWWPRPHGDQPLYTVECELLIGGKPVDSVSRRTGIRSIRINQYPHPETGDYFILEVNGRPIFAKGGNWVPPDVIYARPDAERYRKLVELAVDANFNALRIWGGGLYADHDFLDACDEMGVLVWHDFIFACAKYPGDDADFLNNVRREITHVVRDLSAHPSLLVWCGNNELEWAAWSWGYDRIKPHPDRGIYHLEIPRILQAEDPSRPYWPSSPYSTNYRHPTDPTTGDQHPWHVSLGAGGPDFWEYRKDVSRFPNEGGFLGASSPATLRQFLPEDQRRLFSPAWEFHDNACNYGQPGVVYRAVEHWLGRKPDDFSFEDYAFYSGVLQAEGLQEYIYNFRRRMYSSSSAIFWMYNDSWPASHGWTIVDYYLRRKLAYHPVRRAFAPVSVIPVAIEDKIVVFGVNETPEEWRGEVRYGLLALSGGLPVDMTSDCVLQPNTAAIIGEMPISRWHDLGADSHGAFAVLLKERRSVAQNRLFIAPFKDLKWAEPEIKIERRGDRAVFSSRSFVWAVCLDPDGESPVADDVFDLLPGIEYEIPWPPDAPLPKVRRTASPL